MAKVKAEKKETVVKVKEPETKEVIGIAEAEKLQKEDNGWELISVTKIEPTKEGLTMKKYKFRKE